MKTNQTNYLPLIYSVNQPLRISGKFLAHHQEVFTANVQQLVRVSCLSWLAAGQVRTEPFMLANFVVPYCCWPGQDGTVYVGKFCCTILLLARSGQNCLCRQILLYHTAAGQVRMELSMSAHYVVPYCCWPGQDGTVYVSKFCCTILLLARSGWNCLCRQMLSYHTAAFVLYRSILTRPAASQLKCITHIKCSTYTVNISWWWAVNMPETCCGWLTK
jgi:hypothetical protein